MEIPLKKPHMVNPLSSSQPHGYYSQINADSQSLPPQLMQHIQNFKDQLDQIQEETQKESPDAKQIAEHFKQFDQELNHFFIELNSYNNRGFESQVRMHFEVAHHAFEDKIKEITDAYETSMREALYDDPVKLSLYLEQLNKIDMTRIGQYAKEFSQDLNIFIH